MWSPSEGFVKASTGEGQQTLISKSIKQNNIIIKLLVDISEDIKELKERVQKLEKAEQKGKAPSISLPIQHQQWKTRSETIEEAPESNMR